MANGALELFGRGAEQNIWAALEDGPARISGRRRLRAALKRGILQAR